MNNELPLKWKSKCGRYTVSISHFCFNKMLKMGKKHHPHEVGTSLVGCYSDDGFDAFVLDASPLCSDSRCYDNSFFRGIKGLRAFYNKLQQRYGGRRYYVGEWHSHPNGTPIPSHMDNMTQSAISADSETNCPESILVIIGGNLFAVPELGVFLYSCRWGRIELLYDQT
ncbi:MAG: Mov34/MPN/PAD-1 family protein [candidate division Zixibacteria bacterium]|nr:Mov34/MPN/PAD-1 family protein [candidate division Zixibacteria bacterium]